MCRKRKPRKNTTKEWFLKEASTSTPQQPATSPHENVDAPYEDVGLFFTTTREMGCAKKLTQEEHLKKLNYLLCQAMFC
jgi:hypothetical protein